MREKGSHTSTRPRIGSWATPARVFCVSCAALVTFFVSACGSDADAKSACVERAVHGTDEWCYDEWSTSECSNVSNTTYTAGKSCDDLVFTRACPSGARVRSQGA